MTVRLRCFLIQKKFFDTCHDFALGGICMKITYLVLGPFMTNTYIIYDERTMNAVVIDPSFTPENIIYAVDRLKVNVKGIFLTHAHVDHMAGLNELREVYKEAYVYMNINDKEYLSDPKKNLSDSFPQPTICKAADHWVSHGDHIKIGELDFIVLDTSGHTPGGISFYMEPEKVVFTGDSLFQGSIGRTDFPGGDIKRLLRTIRKNLFSLPDDVIVLSGHGDATSIGYEKKYNPFLVGG